MPRTHTLYALALRCSIMRRQMFALGYVEAAHVWRDDGIRYMRRAIGTGRHIRFTR